MMHAFKSIIVCITIIIIVQLFHTYIKPVNSLEGKQSIKYTATPEILEDTIFVSIPSYRDDKCSDTLDDLFKKAKYPQRIVVGICQQNNVKNEVYNKRESCIEKASDYEGHVRWMTIPSSKAKGPLYARTLIANKLYKMEKYVLMIDAHSVFAKHWDDQFVKQMKFLKSHGISKPILSAYPHDVKTQLDATSVVCINKVSKTVDYPESQGATMFEPNFFYKTVFIGCGCLFAEGEFFRRIPFDEKMQYIFEGEEILLAMHAYTRGFTVYSPASNLIFHHYAANSPHTHSWWADVVNKNVNNSNEKQKESKVMLKRILTEEHFSNMFDFGKGHVRSLKSFWNDVGWDPKTKEFTENHEQHCLDKDKIEYK